MESGLRRCGAAATGGGAGGAGGAGGDGGAGLSNLVPRCSHLTDAWGWILGMCERWRWDSGRGISLRTDYPFQFHVFRYCFFKLILTKKT